MIKLKSGVTIPYNKDFDFFFKNLLDGIIDESRKIVDNSATPEDTMEGLNEVFLKEMMDNCIFVTHQLFELAREYEEMSKFMVSGFIFNSLLLVIQTNKVLSDEAEEDNGETIH